MSFVARRAGSSRRRVAPYPLALLLCVVGCKDNVEPMQREWDTLLGELGTTIAQARTQRDELTQKLAALPKLSDLEREAREAQKELEGLIGQESQALDAVDRAVDDARREVSEAVASGELAVLTQAVAKASQVVAPAVKRLGELTVQVSTKFNEVEGTVSEAVAREKRRLEAIVERKKAREAVLHGGGALELDGLDFSAGSAALAADRPETRAALGELDALLDACPQLKVGLVGHGSAEEDPRWVRKVSMDRALAVGAYLTRRGVAPERIVKLSGSGSATPRPRVAGQPEPEPTDRAALEAARRRDRRVTVEILTPCP